jgi:Na+-driven multidrug efflux pump
LSLSPGILAVALSLILSHYFSGTGQPQHNTISSGLGLIITVLCGFTLIPLWSLPGAGITASIAYTCSLIYQLVVFKRKASLKWNSFLLNREDVDVFRKELKTIRP